MYMGLTEWLESIPELKDQNFNFIDFVPTEPTSYSLIFPPSIPAMSRDIISNETEQLNFGITALNIWGPEMKRNINNLEFFETIKRRFKTATRKGNFPDLGEDKEVELIEALTSGYLEGTDTPNKGRYNIQCRIVYKVKSITNEGNSNRILPRF